MNLQKFNRFFAVLVLIGILILLFAGIRTFSIKITEDIAIQTNRRNDTIKIDSLHIPLLIIESDKDKDGIWDLQDFVEGARKDAANKAQYDSRYWNGGYPPDNIGVCTDVIWRAFKNAGYNLKNMIDKDIAKHPELYKNVNGKPDPNIDFRRVPNQLVFFKRFATQCTNKLIPNDTSNLKEWQAGDVVTFTSPDHIGILSDKRREDGIPYLIHNAGPYTREADDLEDWYTNITGHFRFPRIEDTTKVHYLNKE